MTDNSSDSSDGMTRSERREARQERREERREERQQDRADRIEAADDSADVAMVGSDAATAVPAADAIDIDLADGIKIAGPEGWKVDSIHDAADVVRGDGFEVGGPVGQRPDSDRKWDNLADDITTRDADSWVAYETWPSKITAIDKGVAAEFIEQEADFDHKISDTAPEFIGETEKNDRFDDAVTTGSEGGPIPVDAGETTTGLKWENISDDITTAPDGSLPFDNSPLQKGGEAGFVEQEAGADDKLAEPDVVGIEETTAPAPTDLEWQDLADPIDGDPTDLAVPAQSFDSAVEPMSDDGLDLDGPLHDGDGLDVDG